MKNIRISDVTLREIGKVREQISFREKVETAKLLHKIGANVIEVAKIDNLRTDTLFLHTIAPLVGDTVISCPVGLDPEEARQTWNAVKCASHPRIQVSVPTSTVQMEYICHMKPKALAEALDGQLALAVSLCPDVEFTAEDATRSEPEFLASLIKTAISRGVKTVTLCDTAGTMLPDELSAFIAKIRVLAPELKDVALSVECSDKLSMGTAAVLASVASGAEQIKTATACDGAPSLLSVSDIIRVKGESLGIRCSLDSSLLGHAVTKLSGMLTGKRPSTSPFDNGVQSAEDFVLNKEDDINTVSKYIAILGYDLSEEDISKVYERFKQLAEKKRIGAKELDAIIASNALQVTPTYKLVSYVINCGNIITATANVILEKDGEQLKGISLGDGPIDAAFLAIEQIVGHHYELDDFQIQSVTEGREAVGEALVKLRSSGKLYSGRGISTDIVGASIRAYINALNKICFEDA